MKQSNIDRGISVSFKVCIPRIHSFVASLWQKAFTSIIGRWIIKQLGKTIIILEIIWNNNLMGRIYRYISLKTKKLAKIMMYLYLFISYNEPSILEAAMEQIVDRPYKVWELLNKVGSTTLDLFQKLPEALPKNFNTIYASIKSTLDLDESISVNAIRVVFFTAETYWG